MLRMRQFAVHEVGSVADAHEALDAPYNWVLLDLMLPDGNGMEVLRRIKGAGLPAKVCVITGCSSEALREARDCGADEALLKPVDVEHLLGLLTPASLPI